MSRSRSAAVVLSAIALCLAVPAGPAFAGEALPAGPSTPAPATTVPPTSAIATATTQPRTPAPESADLRLSVWFDRPSYFATQEITAHASVTNAGTKTASRVTLVSTGNFSTSWWSPISPLGVPVEPGQTVTGSAAGYVTTTSGPVTLTVTAALPAGEPDADPADNTVTVSVPVTHVSGSLRGTVYGDRNGNGAMDPGEALAGLAANTSGGVPTVQRSTTTDARGRFTFPDLPAGSYYTWFGPAPGWFLLGPGAEVTGTGDPDLLIRAAPSVDTWLSASMAFTRPVYRKDEVAHLTLNLTNKGQATLAHLTAACWATGSGQVETGVLAEGGPGVAIPAGQRRIFGMTVRITAEEFTEGYLRVHCTVGTPPNLNGTGSLQATARIPGGLAPRVDGYLGLFRDKPQLGLPNSDPLPGVKVYLKSQVTGAVVARAVSGSSGGFTFFGVPAGLYDFGIVGPWQLVYSDPEFVVRDGENGVDPDHPYRHLYFVVPGPYQRDPDPATPPAVRPAPAAAPAARSASTPSRGLAETGVAVAWLALGAFLTTTTGAALVLGTSRRRWR
ncbi:hypothetical protein H4696_002850 [Amycolatopsis lexingtonensis]|uniref:SD-repeat containing protein B domain-containing protein n=1 Tax=Amycolatopsis lexingtonensis TaxID=218822 RepID=A0ABR9HXU4_9PSEU|nr:hypothetical protein [Amycolatopsis lexingtonensis]MBE1495750.1 hypothetical protein [Amycolatopsis lexingtonensis]